MSFFTKNFMQINTYNMGVTKNAKDVLDSIQNLKLNANKIRNGEVLSGAVGLPSTLISSFGNMAVALNAKDGELITYTLEDTKQPIYLPIPNTIVDSHSQKYDETTFNMEERMLRTGIGAMQALTSQVSSGVANTIPYIMSTAEHLMKRGNITIDPNNLMTYAGSIPRSFTFDFNLTPNSADEAEYFTNSINMLRNNSIAERNENKFFDELGIRTLSITKCFDFKMQTSAKNSEGNTTVSDIDFMNEMMFCSNNPTGGFFLSGIHLNIDGQDALQVYYDGTPKIIRLTLSFIERKPLYFDDWMNHTNKVL
jgi:hypothetical protein